MNEFYAGFLVGVSQTFIGHPFDTLKVLYQNKIKIQNINVKLLYRGWGYPLISGCIFNSIVFPVYEYSYKKTKNTFLSGAMSGIIVSPFVYMFDIGKIKRQVNSPLQMSDFYKTKGLPITYCREFFAMSIYFSSYFKCKDMGITPFYAGGISGLANWTITYPMDVLRTRQMTKNISIWEAFRERSLWRGYSICASRAVIVNAVSFKTYEIFKKYNDTY